MSSYLKVIIKKDNIEVEVWYFRNINPIPEKKQAIVLRSL